MLNLKNYHLTPILLAAAYKRTATAMYIHENYPNNILNLKELTFNKNPHYSVKDPNVNVTDPTCFKYYLNHEFCKLKKNINSGKNDKFSLLHANICSLQGNFEKLEMLHSDLEYQFSIIALTGTWHNDNNPSFVAGILPGYQKYESTSGSTKKRGFGVVKGWDLFEG